MGKSESGSAFGKSADVRGGDWLEGEVARLVTALGRIALGIHGRRESGLLSNERGEGGLNYAKPDWQLAQEALADIDTVSVDSAPGAPFSGGDA